MLHTLCRIRERWTPQLNLSVVHFNHKLRSASDSEVTSTSNKYNDYPKFCKQQVDFVSGWCNKYSVPLHLRELPEEKRVSIGLQAAARDWRRAEATKLIEEETRRNLGDSVGESSSGAFIATAHHKDDQVETLLLKLLRGVHISNMHGVIKDH